MVNSLPTSFVNGEWDRGDPLSPYLFNLAADSLCKLFFKDKNNGSIIGLGPPNAHPLSMANCHYADDTIIFLKADPKNKEHA